MTSSQERIHFDQILESTIASLPKSIQKQLEEVPLIVEDEPPAGILNQVGIEARSGETNLCGLYVGSPLTEASFLESTGTPAQIYLFRGPILRLARYQAEEIANQIRITLLHEIGHHLGFDENKLEDLGYE